MLRYQIYQYFHSPNKRHQLIILNRQILLVQGTRTTVSKWFTSSFKQLHKLQLQLVQILGYPWQNLIQMVDARWYKSIYRWFALQLFYKIFLKKVKFSCTTRSSLSLYGVNSDFIPNDVIPYAFPPCIN